MIWPLFRGEGRNPGKTPFGFLEDLKTPKGPKLLTFGVGKVKIVIFVYWRFFYSTKTRKNSWQIWMLMNLIHGGLIQTDFFFKSDWVKFRYSEKATKIWNNLPFFWRYSHSASKIWMIVSNFFGLLRMSELYISSSASIIQIQISHAFWDLCHPLRSMDRRMKTTLVKSTSILWRYEWQCILGI